MFYILGQNQCYRFEVGTTNYSGWLSSPGSHSELYQPGKTLLEIRFSQVYTLDVWVSDNSQRNVRFSSLLAQNNATQIHKYPRKNFPFWEKLFFWISSRQAGDCCISYKWILLKKKKLEGKRKIRSHIFSECIRLS